jgi:transcriptional regulator with XRE-family HTH domain
MQEKVADKLRYSGYFALPALRYWRIERGLSMRELAREAGFTLDTIWRLETLQRRAEPKTRRSLARALGVKPTNLSNEPPEEGEPIE